MLACAVAVQLGAEQHFHPLGQDQKPCVWQLCWALRQASLGVLPTPVPLPPPPPPSPQLPESADFIPGPGSASHPDSGVPLPAQVHGMPRGAGLTAGRGRGC